MDIKLHNSSTGQKEVFTPINPKEVKVYFCGPTTYDLVHIGNLRAFMTADILIRTLRSKYPTTFVRNLTDIDDKIIHRAAETGEEWSHLAQRYVDAFHDDIQRAGLLEPDIEPKATHYIEDMTRLAKTLIESDRAYESNGSVYFDSSKDSHYGGLSHRENMVGETQEENPDKRSPKDFAILKAAKPGEPSWDSEWGPIRPGWHSECAAMSQSIFGKKFDIHGGGQDLFFPHHECEDTLCRAVNGTSDHMANYWIHNAMLNVEGKKMSKSLGNFLTIRDVLDKVHPEVLRMYLMSSHYRSTMNFTWDGLTATKKLLDRFYKNIHDDGRPVPDYLLAFLYNDLDTPSLIAELNVLAKRAGAGDIEAAGDMTAAAKAIGLLVSPDWNTEGVDIETIEHLIEQRSAAKLNKDWKLADSIRSQLNGMGIALEDHATHTSWKKK